MHNYYATACGLPRVSIPAAVFVCKDENDDDIIGKDPKLKKKERKKKRKLNCDT